jgi:hypothetical protein
MILTSKDIYRQRVKTCESCEHYLAGTQSCGPLVVGKKITFDNPATGKKQNAKLCGCLIKLKAEFALFGCPLDKWPGVMSRADKRELMALLNKIVGAKRVETSDLEALRRYNLMAGSPMHPVLSKPCSSCGAAMSKLIEKARQVLKEQNIEA